MIRVKWSPPGGSVPLPLGGRSASLANCVIFLGRLGTSLRRLGQKLIVKFRSKVYFEETDRVLGILGTDAKGT